MINNETMRALDKYANERVLVPSPCPSYVMRWWLDDALPTLKDQALSELCRNDEMPPRLIGFMESGNMGVINVADAVSDLTEWGDARSKDATAWVHRLSAMLPGVLASVFCVETWTLAQGPSPSIEQAEADAKYIGDIATHPDRQEAVAFHMLHIVPRSDKVVQLMTMIEVIKVFGRTRSKAAIAGTRFGRQEITDVNAGDPKHRFRGRFIVDK